MFYLVNILSPLWPHVTNIGVFRSVQKAFEILEKSVLVLVQESANVIDHVASIVPDIYTKIKLLFPNI